ncbi:hypothetical protein Tco_1114498 [Tanacetum coccineum]|uniref:Gag-Pol polyprotein n=1 Tax=Tanacetum coccineum TaxID=301880 RepID=A0ABQ5IWR8_9ASTR
MNYLLNVQPKLAPLNPTTNVNAEDNNNNQAVNAPFDEDEFINPFFTPIHKVAKSSSRNVDTSNMHIFYQRHRSDYHWTRDHPLEQVRRYPSKPNIKEAMADHAWIESMQEELHQFDILRVWELVDKPYGKNVFKVVMKEQIG